MVALLAAQKRAMHVAEIATRLGVEAGHFDALERVLDDLSLDGSIASLSGQRFRLSRGQVERQGGAEVEGVLSVHPRGFGFVSRAGDDGDIFIQPESMRGALHGDTVTARIVSRSHKGVEGEIVRIVKRRTARIAGTLRRRGKSVWLEPDDSRLRGPIVLTEATTGEDGDAAVVTLTRFPESPEENPEGKLDAVLGAAGDPEVEVQKILVREGIEEPHPPEAVAEAEAYGKEVDPAALVGREDLTGIPLPTIDPEDARDHDDAIWVTRNEDGSYKAWIAIADVSHYVRPGTALDEAALGRGCSIYLPDRAIPMLPRALSSNLCSLLPDVIRLCLAVEVDLDPTGTVMKSRIVEGYMRSAAKLTYGGVARALGFTTEPEQSPEAEAMRDDLAVLADLARLLRARRMRRGALDFDLPEAKVTLDPITRAPLSIKKRTHDPGVAKAYQLVEELMLLANEQVAQFLVERNVPGIFRVHGAPDPEKLQRFATMCGELGVKFDLEEAEDPKKLSALLKKIAAHPQKQVLNMLLLRAMRQAVYDVANKGHFGLASTAYLHFTSPIRRYPDLVVHRAVRHVLRGEAIDRSEPALERMRNAATVASETERKSMDIEREVVDLCRALYMRDHIGEILEGIVTGLVGSGVFVQIDDPFLDVLVKTESLGPDDYAIDDEKLRIIGRRSGDRIGLGDSMMIEIDDVTIQRRTVYGRRLASIQEKRPKKRESEERRARPKDKQQKKGKKAPARGGRGKR